MTNRLSKFKNQKSRSGIALFILLTSMILLSLSMGELIQTTSTQANRVRNYGDRLEAIYIGRTAQTLTRVRILLDAYLDKTTGGGQLSDVPSEIWAQDMPFPIPAIALQALSKQLGGKEAADQSEEIGAKEEGQALIKKCDDFFNDFPGDAESKAIDLNSLLYLNSLDPLDDPTPATFDTLVALMRPNYDFERSLSARNINPDEVARQIRDYLDKDEIENENQAPESSPYNSAQLQYTPKNQNFTNLDELKLIPLMDDELFDYLSHHVSAVHLLTPPRRKPARFNLNTIDKNTFQALLKQVPNPEQVAESFVKHRKEKSPVYTDTNLKQLLKDNIGLDSDNIRINLLTGNSDAFKIETDVTVNQVKLRLEAVAPRTPGKTSMEPLAIVRVSP